MNKKGRWYTGGDWEYSFVNLFVVIPIGFNFRIFRELIQDTRL